MSTKDTLRKMFTNFCLNDTEANIRARIVAAEESIQGLITLTQFANDESDYVRRINLSLTDYYGV
jgi:hypothetical protein